jgi:Fe-Mn family superoxide dismutase
MKSISNDLIRGIRADLGLDTAQESVNESYVTTAKKYELRTELLSEKTKKSHQELLEDYVETLNSVSAQLDTTPREEANLNNSSFRSLKIDEVYNLNAAYLHALYFENVSDVNSRITMDSLAFMRLQRDFGSFDDWQKDFIACAMSARNGWALTVYSTVLNRYINVVVDLHSVHVPISSFPVIVLDVWEHAYYRDYLKDRKSYVFAMMKELNWDTIEERFKKCDRIAKVVK